MKSSEGFFFFFQITVTWLKVGLRTSLFFFGKFPLAFEVLPSIFSLQRENGCFESCLLSSNVVFPLLRAALVHFKSRACQPSPPCLSPLKWVWGQWLSPEHTRKISMALYGVQSSFLTIILFDPHRHPWSRQGRYLSPFHRSETGACRGGNLSPSNRIPRTEVA